MSLIFVFPWLVDYPTDLVDFGFVVFVTKDQRHGKVIVAPIESVFFLIYELNWIAKLENQIGYCIF